MKFYVKSYITKEKGLNKRKTIMQNRERTRT